MYLKLLHRQLPRLFFSIQIVKPDLIIFLKYSLLFTTIILPISYNSAQTTTTFNKRDDFGALNTQLTNVTSLADAIYFTGLRIDTFDGHAYTSTFIAKSDLYGNIQFSKNLELPFPAPPYSIRIWSPVSIISSDNTILQCGDVVFDGWYRGLLTRTNSNAEVINAVLISNPFGPSFDGITLTGILEMNNDLIICGTVTHPGGFSFDSDIAVWRFDKDFNLKWVRVFGDELGVIHDSPYKIIKDKDQNIYIGGWKDSVYPERYDFKNYIKVLKLDSLGNKLWEYHSPENEKWGPAYDLLFDKDENLIIATAKIYEKKDSLPQPPPVRWVITGTNLYYPTIVKLNTKTFEMEWERPMGNGFYGPENNLSRIVADPKGSGYVASGFFDVNRNDGRGAEIPDQRAFLCKVSPEGDSLWLRVYDAVPEVVEKRNDVVDMEISPDGGYVMCGVAFGIKIDDVNRPNDIRAWMLKVDEYGCLIPGCQLTSASTNLEAGIVKISTYPNPASDVLHFYISSENQKTETYRMEVLSQTGTVVRNSIPIMSDITYSMSLLDLPAGIYFLQLRTERGAVITERFVVAK